MPDTAPVDLDTLQRARTLIQQTPSLLSDPERDAVLAALDQHTAAREACQAVRALGHAVDEYGSAPDCVAVWEQTSEAFSRLSLLFGIDPAAPCAGTPTTRGEHHA